MRKAFGYKGYKTRFSGLQQWLQDKAGLKYSSNNDEYGKRINEIIVPFIESKGAKVYSKGQPLQAAELNANYVSLNFNEFKEYLKKTNSPCTSS